MPLLITRGSQGEVLHHHAPSCGLQDHTTTWLSSGMTWLLRIFPSQHLTECHMKDDNVMILYIYIHMSLRSLFEQHPHGIAVLCSICGSRSRSPPPHFRSGIQTHFVKHSQLHSPRCRAAKGHPSGPAWGGHGSKWCIPKSSGA